MLSEGGHPRLRRQARRLLDVVDERGRLYLPAVGAVERTVSSRSTPNSAGFPIILFLLLMQRRRRLGPRWNRRTGWLAAVDGAS